MRKMAAKIAVGARQDHSSPSNKAKTTTRQTTPRNRNPVSTPKPVERPNQPAMVGPSMRAEKGAGTAARGGAADSTRRQAHRRRLVNPATWQTTCSRWAKAFAQRGGDDQTRNCS